MGRHTSVLVKCLTFAVMIGICTMIAAAAEAQTPPPFPTGGPPGPPAGEIRLLDVQGSTRSHVGPPEIVAPALPGLPGARALGVMTARTEQVAEKDGIILRVTSTFRKTFQKFHIVATLETTDRGTIDSVTWTGPGRFGTSSVKGGVADKSALRSRR